jgi:hypothetical protein
MILAMKRPISFFAILAALVACGHKDDTKPAALSDAKAQADSAAAIMAKLGHHGSGGHRYGPPTGKIRVANVLEVNGQASVPVDLYDTRTPDSAATPLIKSLAFGQISDYVSPRAADDYPNSPSNLYIFPTGTKQASPPYGDRIDNVGYVSSDQTTVALGPSHFAGTSGMSLAALDEAGHRVNSYRDSLRLMAPGQALLVLLQGNVNADSMPVQYLMIDGTCPLTSSYPKNRIPTATGTDINFAVAPGTHTLGIVTSPPGHGLLNCVGKQPGPTTSVTVAAGQKYAVVVYGLPSDGIRVVTAPIASP